MKGKRTGMAAKSRPGDGCDFSSWRCPRRGAGSSRPRRALPAPRPATYPQTRQSPLGGRWLVRARGCARQSPGGRPHEHDSAYQSQGERSVRSAARGPRPALTRASRVSISNTDFVLEFGHAVLEIRKLGDGNLVLQKGDFFLGHGTPRGVVRRPGRTRWVAQERLTGR